MNRAIRFAAAAAVSVLMAYAATVPAGAAGPFDGTYRGRVKLTMNSIPAGKGAGSGRGSCQGKAVGVPAAWTVVDNTFSIKPEGRNIKLGVGPDGTISSLENVGGGWSYFDVFSGKIIGNSMVAEFGTSLCRYRFEGRKGR